MSVGVINFKRKTISHSVSKEESEIFNNKVIDYLNSKGIDYHSLDRVSKQKLIFKLMSSCHKCPISYERETVIKPKINLEPKVLIVSRSSGSQEIAENEILPMTYPAGVLFQKYLNALGLSRSDVYLTNLVMCATKKTFPPELRTTKRCSHWKELELSNIIIPDIILLMGNDSFRYFYGDNAPSVMSILGDMYVSEYKVKNRLFVPILHPVNVLRDSQYAESVSNVLKTVKALVDSGKLSELLR